MKTTAAPACIWCKHFIAATFPKCAAFPRRIPKSIYFNGKPHTEPLKSQKNSLVFEEQEPVEIKPMQVGSIIDKLITGTPGYKEAHSIGIMLLTKTDHAKYVETFKLKRLNNAPECAKLRMVLRKIQDCIDLQNGATECQLKDIWNDISDTITELETE